MKNVAPGVHGRNLKQKRDGFHVSIDGDAMGRRRVDAVEVTGARRRRAFGFLRAASRVSRATAERDARDDGDDDDDGARRRAARRHRDAARATRDATRDDDDDSRGGDGAGARGHARGVRGVRQAGV